MTADVDKMLNELDQIETGGNDFERTIKLLDSLKLEYELDEWENDDDAYARIDISTDDTNSGTIATNFLFKNGNFLRLEAWCEHCD